MVEPEPILHRKCLAQFKSLNRSHPLNQAAKKELELHGERLLSNSLHVLQLLQWGEEERVPPVLEEGPRRDLDNLEEAQAHDPRQAMRVFLMETPGEEPLRYNLKPKGKENPLLQELRTLLVTAHMAREEE
ncbi:hypothetical protein ACFL4G_02195 [Thermodesulfobacteriota bacterium]